MAIETVEFDLSMVNPDTGRYLTANVYTVDGVTNADGSLRELSMGQLVMALCLKRAAELECNDDPEVPDIVSLMEEMQSTTAMLEALTSIEQYWVDKEKTVTDRHGFGPLSAWYVGAEGPYKGMNQYKFLTEVAGISLESGTWIGFNGYTGSSSPVISYEDLMSQIESKMDEKNSFSQQKMIELQSLTNKRDQSYDMISNILKSLNTSLVGNANNM